MRIVLAIGLMVAVACARVAAESELSKYSFTVVIEGKTLGTFRQVSGLSVETEVIEYRDGGGGTTIFLPGNTKYSPVRLTRAFTGDSALWDWYTTSAATGHVTRFDGTISVFDRSGQPVARYTLTNAWPRKYEGPTLNAGGTDVAIETIEIVHDGLQMTRSPGTP
jgi:phage tail-like protein